MTQASPLVLLTGVNGFVGQHMAACLLEHGMDVVGIGRRAFCGLQHPRLAYISGDMAQESFIKQLISAHSFTYIIHLAGANDVSTSYKDPVSVMEANAWSTLQLLEAVRTDSAAGLKGFLAIGTAYEYDLEAVPAAPLAETAPLLPGSPYAWSKLVMGAVVQMYGRVYGIPALLARTFNLIGPGPATGVCAVLAKQVAQMEKGLLPPKLHVGNTTVRRDFLDVRDAVEAYLTLLPLASSAPGSVYNVCSGKAVPISAIIELLKRCANVPFEVTIDKRLIRPSEAAIVQGDYSKLRQATTWQPGIPLAQTVLDTLNYYRSLV
ncbi:GDP-mannose 4,6-dehydratase [Paenibacillus whitsoniae]|uniref:NAD-dependent epimerase/dehydratase family protein n=1 Tax=Paenibacillus whitsoniae TaxID=2496558 RepID=A0A430JG44_9BACL|nr:GDP-mannose 4,6-dehydratase [Paenibacillus whitsoniae]RTE10022.1 NAD-dependent epimerase/dehydratase family protein [Paenibacillus whitsoniae]